MTVVKEQLTTREIPCNGMEKTANSGERPQHNGLAIHDGRLRLWAREEETSFTAMKTPKSKILPDSARARGGRSLMNPDKNLTWKKKISPALTKSAVRNEF